MLTLGSHRVRALLAEHVWEHLDSDDMDVANRLAFEFLEHGGHFRIAVPEFFDASRNSLVSLVDIVLPALLRQALRIHRMAKAVPRSGTTSRGT